MRMSKTSAQLITQIRSFADEVDDLRFTSPVEYVYNPLIYARPAVEQYIKRWARLRVPALLLGMNPGPFGMVQTGIPFGEVAMVRDFIGIDAEIGRPPREHPKRPVLGFDCPRSEVSGRRLWNWGQEHFGTAQSFFRTFFVWNYCPLAFLEEGGRNRTPDKLPASERSDLEALCDSALSELVDTLKPKQVIGVGAFATRCAERVVGDRVPIGTVLHPSPASPKANRGWAAQAEVQLRELGLLS